MLNIVLVEPEIPENTGNISRTCSVTGARLHLVRPLGFSVDDKHLKRAGLDYWQYLDITYYDSFEEVEERNPDAFLSPFHSCYSFICGCGIPRRRLSCVWQGDCGPWAGTARAAQRGCRAHTDAQRPPLAQPFKLGCNSALRGDKADKFPQYALGTVRNDGFERKN